MNVTKVFFLGAGPGDPELLTIRGLRLLERADTVVYAGSLVSRKLLEFCPQAELVDSAPLCLDDIIKVMVTRAREGKNVVRLHSGDPSLFGAIKEQIARLRKEQVSFEVVPGVTSLSAVAAALESELTVPEVSQTVIITRAAGRTPVPELEDIGSLAAHRATMAIFLSVKLVDEVQKKLLMGYAPDTPAAVVHNASRPDQQILRTTVEKLPADIAAAGIDHTAIILVGESLAQKGEESLLYKEGFSHGYRE